MGRCLYLLKGSLKPRVFPPTARGTVPGKNGFSCGNLGFRLNKWEIFLEMCFSRVPSEQWGDFSCPETETAHPAASKACPDAYPCIPGQNRFGRLGE